MAVSTAELIKKIQLVIDMGEFKADNEEELLTELPHEYLNRMLTQKKLQLSAVCALSELDASYCYRILAGTRKPSRDTLLHITLAMELSLEETQFALRLYQLARLDPRCYRDAAIIFAVTKRYSPAQTVSLLFELGESEI